MRIAPKRLHEVRCRLCCFRGPCVTPYGKPNGWTASSNFSRWTSFSVQGVV